MRNDSAFKDSDQADFSDIFGVKRIQTIGRLEWDYRRRLGNVVLKQIKFIGCNTCRYDKIKKHKTNDKKLKRNTSARGGG